MAFPLWSEVTAITAVYAALMITFDNDYLQHWAVHVSYCYPPPPGLTPLYCEFVSHHSLINKYACASQVVTFGAVLYFSTSNVWIYHLKETLMKKNNATESTGSKPIDRSGAHVWLWEFPTTNGVLSQDGVQQIAFHKYKGSEYTILDNLMNPIWEALADRLPMSMAPNVVTTIGGLHALMSYIVTWFYTTSWNTSVPGCLLIFNAYCITAYYTLDCMDGKQARRTGSSSPLGQLFDHGIDVLCLISQCSAIHAYVGGGGTRLFLSCQFALQISGFMAQWEEYNTGVLPHKCGQIGVTEVNYGLALFSLVNGIIPVEVRDAFYDQPLQDVIPSAWLYVIPSTWLYKEGESNESRHWLVNGGVDTQLRVRNGMQIASLAFFFSMMFLCVVRVLILHNKQPVQSVQQRFSAFTKLFSPIILSLVTVYALPDETVEDHGRLVSLSVGLCLALLTIKMIVFGMARQAYATIQLDIALALVAIAWVCADRRLRESASEAAVWMFLVVWYLYRVLTWILSFVGQICHRLNIRLFSLKKLNE